MSEWAEMTLGEVMELDIDAVEVRPDASYEIVGVLNRGRGLLYRDPISGTATSYKTLNRIAPGQVVYSRLKAFEGAITVAPGSPWQRVRLAGVPYVHVRRAAAFRVLRAPDDHAASLGHAAEPVNGHGWPPRAGKARGLPDDPGAPAAARSAAAHCSRHGSRRCPR